MLAGLDSSLLEIVDRHEAGRQKPMRTCDDECSGKLRAEGADIVVGDLLDFRAVRRTFRIAYCVTRKPDVAICAS
ncbi:hypothetical protein JQ615_05880 [Bradyrhizobium jicamae]|uniref:RCK N-terminal domain-containing protein n=1 Tax=Bradyrhizobium jicamae TaxID=280332 RepID=A0ABS5FDP7_9BRAD|nr:hypothetical protein [Bradyrhizobium jicamae]MBR0794916.1 hypothetical protein [Bradyrhizobium jicamae]